MVAYFQEFKGVPKIQGDMNPATWYAFLALVGKAILKI
jgi:hypothetical protein